MTFDKHDIRGDPLFMTQEKIYTKLFLFVFSTKIEKLSERSSQRELGLVGYEFL